MAELPDGQAVHEYAIWNAHASSRRVTIAVWRGSDVVLDRAVRFPARGVLSLTVFRPGCAYAVVVDPADGPRFVTSPTAFDCNFHGWEIAVLPDGEVASRRLQTLVLCQTDTGSNGPTPSPTDGR